MIRKGSTLAEVQWDGGKVQSYWVEGAVDGVDAIIPSSKFQILHTIKGITYGGLTVARTS